MNVRDGYFKPHGLAYIDSLQASKLNNVVVHEHDVLLNITGASVARVCLAPKTVDSGRVNQHVSIIRTKNSLEPAFLEAFLLFPRTKRKLLSIAEAGATRQAITKAQIEEFKIPVPNLKAQQEFVKKGAQSRRTEIASERQLSQLDALFSALQHRAFCGEL
jgi:type I restriction enzyme, S subunit